VVRLAKLVLTRQECDAIYLDTFIFSLTHRATGNWCLDNLADLIGILARKTND